MEYIDLCKVIKEMMYNNEGKVRSISSRRSYWEKRDKSNYYDYIIDSTSFLDNNVRFVTRIWHIMNNIYEIPRCQKEDCSNLVKWKSIGRYSRYCSKKCSSNSIEGKIHRSKNLKLLNKKSDFQDKRKKGITKFIEGEDYDEYRKKASERLKKQHIETNLNDKIREYYKSKKYINSEDKKNRSKRMRENNPMFDHLIVKRSQETKLQRYGDPFYSNREKCKMTNLERYGVEFSIQNVEIEQKRRNTCLERYGSITPLNDKSVREKIKSNNIKKYNREWPSQLHISKESLKKLEDKEWLELSLKSKTVIDLSNELGIHVSNLRVYLKKHDIIIKKSRSNIEQLVEKFLYSLGDIEIISNSRQIIPPHEIDIYLPEYSIAIEINGAYWHSENNNKDKNYHLNKTKLCNEKDISLIHIWDFQWLLQEELVKSRLKAKMGLNKRVFARKTIIRNIDDKIKSTFLNRNHIQYDCKSSCNLGLFLNDDLVSVMTFGKSRFNKKYEWELLRFCSALQINVLGGASKMFKYFLKEKRPNSVISYCDRMWNSGKVYENLGFKYLYNSPPSYYYTKNHLDFENRQVYQKHKLKDKLDLFDENLSEWENMKMNNYDRIWDCGNSVWLYQL